jgi:hypothetical protein
MEDCTRCGSDLRWLTIHGCPLPGTVWCLLRKAGDMSKWGDGGGAGKGPGGGAGKSPGSGGGKGTAGGKGGSASGKGGPGSKPPSGKPPKK